MEFSSVQFSVMIGYTIALFCMGFCYITKGRVNRYYPAFMLISLLHGVVLLVLSLVAQSWSVAVLAIVWYFLVPGAGQIVALIFMRESRKIGPLSWLLTILLFGVVIYSAANGYIIVK